MKRKLLLLSALLCSSITFAQYTYVPDDGFEGRLQQLGLDSGPLDNLVLTAFIENLETFNFSGFVINDITGLEDFVSLKDLTLNNSYGNVTDLSPIENLTLLEELALTDVEATTLNTSALTNLTFIYFVDNGFTSLDFSNSNNLLEISIGNTPLTDINLSNNPLLDDLAISETDLTELDLSSCVALTYASIAFNPSLISLDVSQSPLLEVIYCDDNISLPYLDLSANTGLISVNARDNTALETIYINNGTNTNIGQSFRVKDNPSLSCVEVDDVSWSNTYWGYVTDYFPGFSLSCTPSNDDCAQATPITLAQPASGTTLNASNSTNTPSCQETGITILDIWYQFPAPASGSVTMTINAPPLVGKIALYESCTDASPIACQEGELAITGLTPNATYYLQVWLEADIMNRNGASPENMNGGFILNVQDTSTLSVNDISTTENQILMYPNPASNQLNINTPTNLKLVTIYDMSGKLILQNENIASNSHVLQLEQLSSGMYMVQIKTETTTTLKKLLIN